MGIRVSPVSEMTYTESSGTLNPSIPYHQGQSVKAIKLCQIAPYASDFQTLNNLGSWQPVGASKN